MYVIQIGFSRSRDPAMIGSVIIAESEKRNYSHAFSLYTSPTDLKKYIFQASHGKVNLMTYEDFISKNIITKLYKFEVNDDKFTNFMSFINSNLGIVYSRCQIIWLTIKKALQIKRWPDCIYKYIKNDKQEEICSELQLRVFDLLSDIYQIPDDLQVDQFTPSDLDTLLTQYNIPVEVING